MWKFVSFLFHFAVVYEVIITIIYWSILYRFEKVSSPLEHLFVMTSLVHMLPMTYLIIDFSLNRI